MPVLKTIFLNKLFHFYSLEIKYVARRLMSCYGSLYSNNWIEMLLW